MKTKYILLSVCIFCTTLCFGQKKLFDKYADESGVISIYISKSMFDLVWPSIQTAGLQLSNMSGKVEGLQLLTTEKKELADRMRKDFSTIVTKEHEELMRVRSDGTKANFYIQKQGENISEMLMIADADNSFVIIQLVGNFTLKDIQEITGEVQKKVN
ncbi:MAG: DUF4252 domain-containing protein [Tannerellaceae bacterium]|nr:DUF4252 domain-containing protein [Tannerellaceae bacterium]